MVLIKCLLKESTYKHGPSLLLLRRVLINILGKVHQRVIPAILVQNNDHIVF